MATTTNSLNINASGVVTFNATTGVFSESAITQHDVLLGSSGNAITSLSPSTSGFILTSNGLGFDPSFAVNPGATSTTYVNSSPYTVLATDDVILMDTTLFAAAMSVVLPAAPTQDGKVWTIKDWSGSASTFNVTITVSGGANIDGTASFVLNENYQAVSIVWSVAEATYSVVYDYKTVSVGSVTIAGDTGSITGSSLTIFAGNLTQNSGSSVLFSNSLTTSTLDVTDTNGNTLIGNLSGNATLTGLSNTSLGKNNFTNLTSGSTSVAIGATALQSTQADNNNVAIGFGALNALNGASGIVAIGSNALSLSDTQTGSTVIGNGAFRTLTGAGNNNTGLGSGVGSNLVTGANNCLIGFNAGTAYTTSESGNILINNPGVILDANTLRIGAATGSTGRDLNKAFIYGINGNTVSNTQMVTISSVTSQLGTQAIPAAALTWVDVTSATQTIVVNTGYVTDNATTVTYTLPASPAFGTIFEITGGVSGAATTPWIIAQNAGQQMHLGAASTTVGTGGSIASALQFDSVKAVCIVGGASAVWNILSSVGSGFVVT